MIARGACGKMESRISKPRFMRVLLAHNSLYYPSYGGGDKSNRLLMEALAARGHTVRVAARVEEFGAKAHHALFEELARRGARPEETDRRDSHASQWGRCSRAYPQPPSARLLLRPD